MKADGPVQRSIAEHVLWCREELDRLSDELARYRDGTLSVGERKIGEPVTQGTITHTMYLQHTIADLSRVIAAYSPPFD